MAQVQLDAAPSELLKQWAIQVDRRDKVIEDLKKIIDEEQARSRELLELVRSATTI